MTVRVPSVEPSSMTTISQLRPRASSAAAVEGITSTRFSASLYAGMSTETSQPTGDPSFRHRAKGSWWPCLDSQSMSPAKVLITGAQGFVGRHLTTHLEASGDDVIGV